MKTLYDFVVTAQDDSKKSLADYKDQVVLVVNTATGCAFTPQYTELQKLYDTYKDKGFSILDFPCNQFGKQAEGTDEEIHDFCVGRFSMTFPQFSKIDVNGPNEDSLYTWLKSEAKGAFGSKIKWNFTKFLVDREGHVVARYAPKTTPVKIEADILKLL